MSKTYFRDKRMKYNNLTNNIICQMLVYEPAYFLRIHSY